MRESQSVAESAQVDGRPSVGPSLPLLASKLQPPWARSGIVPRTMLVERLLAHPSVPIVCVVAPPGYGKTTTLAQWAERKRRVAWVTVDRRDNDPTVLLTYIAAALDRIEPVDPKLFRALAAPAIPGAARIVPWLATMSAMTEPFTLVLDNLESLEDPECLDVVAELAAQFSGRPLAGSQLVLASRTRPPLPTALLRAPDRVLELGVDELAMDRREAGALLEGAGLRLDEAETSALIRRTEGWPVALYLAALSLQAGHGGEHDEDAFAGDDRLMAEYLWSELLARLEPEKVSFLTQTAVLDRMCGPLCDAVLEEEGSGEVLEELAESNLLLVPLDRRRQWYRYHQLFADLLRAELERHEPELVGQLHRRAATWCEANGLAEAAVDHAQAAGDADRVARLVAGLIWSTTASGRVDTARHWLAWFEDQGLIERYPLVALLGAWVHALWGQPAIAMHLADAAERGSFAETVPDGSTMESYRALLEVLLCRNGVDRMRADAAAALAGLSPASQWRTLALLLEGILHVLDGQAEPADQVLADAVELGTRTGALPGVAVALAERCLIAIARHDWAAAESLADRALSVVRARRLDDYVVVAVVYAVAARTAAHRGEAERAQGYLARAARLRPQLTYAVPHLYVQTLLELGRAYFGIGDAAGTKECLREAQAILRRRPDLGVLPQQAAELQSKLGAIHERIVGASSLTRAELRLLPLLSTHFSFREIGERLFVTQNTVKKHALAVYQKLGVSSRSEAVERARELGLGA
jgi:LuxR family maltose regulon positive regulatory protein